MEAAGRTLPAPLFAQSLMGEEEIKAENRRKRDKGRFRHIKDMAYRIVRSFIGVSDGGCWLHSPVIRTVA